MEDQVSSPHTSSDIAVTVREVIGMNEAPRGFAHESEILLRQLDGHLARLCRDQEPADVVLAERLADVLRRLIAETAYASAADRARVRAAVHYLALRRDRRPGRPLGEHLRVVADILLALGRPDLALDLTPEPA
jgi:hypothetical protein